MEYQESMKQTELQQEETSIIQQRLEVVKEKEQIKS